MTDPINAKSTNKSLPGVTGENDAGGAGVFGFSATGPGVEGLATTVGGIGVRGTIPPGIPGGGIGVQGISQGAGVLPGGTGVQGIGTVGVHGDSDSGDAVLATTKGTTKNAVFATNNGQGSAPTGGPPGGNGVFGLTFVTGGTGVFGSNNSTKGRGVQGNGPEVGVGGFSDAGNGILAQTKSGIAILAQGAKAGRFEGDVEVTGILRVDGDVSLKRRDLAEQFETSVDCEPGTAMIIGENGKIIPCNIPYDKRAIGVVSGAGPLKPAITLGDRGGAPGTALPIAMIGTVYCLVDADRSPIEIGDLLTSSSTVGHAMKAQDPTKSFGAVIGKALASLGSGHGLIPILVALQ